MTVRSLRAVAAISARDVLARPGGLVTTAVFDLMVTAILAVLWTAAVSAHGGPIAGYSAAALVWYIACSEAGTVSLPMRLIETTGDDVVTDRFATELLRPIAAVSVRVVREIGAAVPRVAVCAVVGAVVAFVAAGAPPEPAALALAAPSLVMAIALNIVAQHVVAGAAFWVRDAKTGWFIYQKLVFVLGGMLIPLELLPVSLERVAKVLPFAAMAYAPARLAAGHVEPALLVVQAFWLALLGLAAIRVFARGERRLTKAVR